MAPTVKHSDNMVRIIVLLTIGSMVTDVGCSKPPQNLPPESLLTEEIAKQADLSTDLHEFSSIEAAAAESLAKRKGTLYLSGLTSLSDAAAEALGKHQGTLDLNGLTSLSDAAAKALAKHEGTLDLKGLVSLSDTAAEALGKHEGSLELSGLTSLSNKQAKALAKHKGYLLIGPEIQLSASKILKDAGHEVLTYGER